MRNNSNQNKKRKNPYIRRCYIRITSEILSAAGAAAGRWLSPARSPRSQQPHSEGLAPSWHGQCVCVCVLQGLGGREVVVQSGSSRG